MLHLLIVLFAAYLIACYAWGLYVTFRLLRSGVRRVRHHVEPAAPPLAKIAPSREAEQPQRRRAA